MTTKASVTLLASQTLAAAAAIDTPQTTISTFDSFIVYVRLTNGATAPTTVPKIVFFRSDRTGVKYKAWEVTGDLVANSVTDRAFEHSKGDMFANCTITWGATTGGTIEAYAASYIN